MSRDKPTILMTGASGVVGGAILRELAARGEARRVICLTHRGHVSIEGVRVLRSDLSRPRMGLDPDDYRQLVRDTDVVIHSGALTEWGQPDERYRVTNVGGTERVVEFARDAEAPVHHMSTAFVAAVFDDAPMKLRPDNIVANYVRSKRDSEQLLRDSGLPHSIWRPTNLIGDSRTGATVRGQIVQLVSAWLFRGRAPMFPAHPGNRVDVVPQDLLAIPVVTAIDAGETGRAYWVTYGDEAMTVEDLLEICAEHGRRLGRRVQPPAVVHPDDIDPADIERLPGVSRNYLRVLVDVSEITACSGGTLPTSMPDLRARLGVPVVDDKDAFRLNLTYWTAEGA
jgi:nucleoside-diphosphate-sugar epimerase